jgi:hypothetical protein
MLTRAYRDRFFANVFPSAAILRMVRFKNASKNSRGKCERMRLSVFIEYEMILRAAAEFGDSEFSFF